MMTSDTESYRDILYSVFFERNSLNSSYSLRAFARDAGISPQRLSNILNNKHGLSKKAALSISENLKFEKDQKDLFCLLVEGDHSRSKKLKQYAKLKIQEIRNAYRKMDIDYMRLIYDWYHFAIMEMTVMENFKSDPVWIGEQLDLSTSVTSSAINRLLKYNFLIEDEKGNLTVPGSHFFENKGIPNEYIRKFHSQVLEKALSSISLQSTEERNLSSTIIAIHENDYAEAVTDINKFREKFDKKYSKTRSKNKLYCLSIQFFNLLKNKKSNQGEK